MSLTKLTENLNNVGSLPDAPTLQPDELKAIFDLAGNTIKEYINTVLTIEIEKMITETVNSAKVIVENVLTSTSTTNALSSGQGKALKDLVDIMKSKLDGIEEGATKNVNLATTSINGLMSSADKNKLNDIATGATKNIVEDILTSSSPINALSAGQGKILKELIDSKQNKILTGSSTPNGGSSGDIYVQTF